MRHDRCGLSAGAFEDFGSSRSSSFTARWVLVVWGFFFLLLRACGFFVLASVREGSCSWFDRFGIGFWHLRFPLAVLISDFGFWGFTVLVIL